MTLAIKKSRVTGATIRCDTGDGMRIELDIIPSGRRAFNSDKIINELHLCISFFGDKPPSIQMEKASDVRELGNALVSMSEVMAGREEQCV